MNFKIKQINITKMTGRARAKPFGTFAISADIVYYNLNPYTITLSVNVRIA